MVTLIINMLHIDGWTKLQEFSDILAWFYVLNDSIFIRSLLSLISVRAAVLNIFLNFCSFSLLKFLVPVVFVFLQLKNFSSHSRKTIGNNFRFSYENSSVT